MRLKKTIFYSIIFLIISLSVYSIACQTGKETAIISPIINIGQVASIWSQNNNPVWQPPEKPDNFSTDLVEIQAQSALVIDSTDNKRLLYAKNANQVLPIASLTKIMTALVALKSVPLDYKMIVSHQAAQIGETTMNLKSGEKLILKELLYGLFLVSGNDAAIVIAENIAGRVPIFVNLMNKMAKQLDLANTFFYNPHGLDQDQLPNNQSTVYELAALSYYLIDNFPIIKTIAGTDNITIQATKDHQEYQMINNLGLERTYPGLSGLKPGYTDSAGYCLVGLAKRENQELMVVILGSPALKDDLVSLLDYWLAEE